MQCVAVSLGKYHDVHISHCSARPPAHSYLPLQRLLSTPDYLCHGAESRRKQLCGSLAARAPSALKLRCAAGSARCFFTGICDQGEQKGTRKAVHQNVTVSS